MSKPKSKAMRTVLALLPLFFSGFYCSAQSTSLGIMPTIDHSGTIDKHWSYSLYYFGCINLINRTDRASAEEQANFFVFYGENALSYRINQGLSVSGAYVYERQHPFGSNYRNEHRYFVQGTWKYKTGNIELRHRLRYDGRFIQDRVKEEFPYTSRIRYLFGANVPIKEGELYLNTYNEFFFNTYRAAQSIYGENWAYAGLGLKTGKSSAFEAGPLYIFWVNGNAFKDMNHFLYLQLTWATHFNFSKHSVKQ